jgi:hypothetical protein
MNNLELERQSGKIVRAIMTRNRAIAADAIQHLKTQMSPADVIGVMLVSIERLVWFEPETVSWAIENAIPQDVTREIQTLTRHSLYKQLIGKGLMPGLDFSVNQQGELLLNQKAKKAASAGYFK